ncbi:MAG TPA: hypothetical protein VFU29_05180 [Chitinophagaceae bacterium]|nr:hypothetical protein [Chitinophagaceae bacterium]
MKILTSFFLIIFFFIGCTNDKGPDVSNIKVDIPIERFDKSFFALDTNNIATGLKELMQSYPDFYTDFMQQILGVSGSDSNKVTHDVSKIFIRGYSSMYQNLSKQYSDVNWLQKDIQKAFQYVKYYFPEYKTSKIVLFMGPFDAPGVALTGSGIAIGLHQFGGKDFPAYQSMEAQQLFPAYISRRFESQYIVVNCMKAVIEDIYPDKSGTKGLVEQMIEKGKQWWLLDKFLPATPDSLKTGFTKQQLSWCEANEGMIWNDIITTQKDLYTKDPMSIQNYLGEAPYTQSLGPSSPGNTGQWIGWQIVKTFADKNSSMSVPDVLKTDARKILEEARYKPK